MRRFWLQRDLVIFVIFCTGMCLCTIPCLAGYTYYSGGPDLFVSLGAGNELVPGTTVDLPLVLQNKGTITMESYNVYTLQPEYLPTTAKFATVQLVPGDAPVRVKSNPQIVGDIASGMVVPAEFIVEVPQDATAGRYTMQAIVTYRYVPRVEQEALGTVQYTFKDANISLPVPVVIRPVVILSVEDVFSTFLHAGGEGYVTFTIRNTGQDTGNRTSVYLSPEGASPVVPFTNGVFIGDFPPGATARPRFKVAISPNADPTRPCPVTLYAVYRDFEGNTITSPQVSAGVMLGEKVQFERTSPPPVLHPGKTETFNVTYRNIGTSMVFNARARISVIDPFSSDDDTAYLGTLGPGDSATAVFSIRTDGGATPKTYSVDSEVEYIDAYRTAFSSDNIPVILDVQPPSNNWLIALVVLFALAIGAGVTWWYRKRAADVK